MSFVDYKTSRQSPGILDLFHRAKKGKLTDKIVIFAILAYIWPNFDNNWYGQKQFLA